MRNDSEDLTMRDDRGIIICDASNDGDDFYDPTDDGNDEDRDNSDVFSQEYMLEFARRQAAEIARNRCIDRLISVGFFFSALFCLRRCLSGLNSNHDNMKTIRLCLFVAVMLVSAISIQAQIFDPDKPMIREFVISVDSINMQLKKYQYHEQDPLYETYGSVQIPNTYYVHNGKSMGIIVTRAGDYSFHAFDARCAHCFHDLEILLVR